MALRSVCSEREATGSEERAIEVVELLHQVTLIIAGREAGNL